jgi:hypothetical protein
LSIALSADAVRYEDRGHWAWFSLMVADQQF